MQQYEGFENVKLLLKYNFNTNATPASVGWSFMNDTVKTDHYVDLSGGHGSVMNITWQAAPWLMMGGTKKVKSILDPLNNAKWTACFAGHFDKKLQWGLGFTGTSETLEKTAITDTTFYFNHASGDNTIGSQMKYN